MRVIALDIGERRVGVAFGDTASRVAVPLTVLPANEVEVPGRSFKRVLEDHEPDMLLCGRPLTMAGEEGPQAQRVMAIARKVADACGLELAFTDERLSSAQAKRILHEQGLSERQMRGKIDCIAASLFLK
ncbi:MAG: Holliday junction resolvase RuvX, partial [Coriobacteriia bacterium]|nr:Holliday junction resolvase RuvX [Coriobacteriia bacterium]